jgi:hypothetical protein
VTATARPVEPRFSSPQTYTPKHLAEKILTSKSALEGERKQVTVLFADLKGSMELLADRDPEEARKLLDPVLEHMIDLRGRGESGAEHSPTAAGDAETPKCRVRAPPPTITHGPRTSS